MNTREAYKALLDGHKVKDCVGDVWSMDDAGVLHCEGAVSGLLPSFAPYELCVAPATDAELVAEMRHHRDRMGQSRPGWAEAMNYAALMLEQRSVKP